VLGSSLTIAVIGAGIVGASTALLLSRDGHCVTVLEQGQVGHGCSWGNGAQYNIGSTLPMAYPGVISQALRWLGSGSGPVKIAPRQLLSTLPWFWRFFRSGRPEAWEAGYAALHALNAPCVDLYRDMLGESDWSTIFRPNGALQVWRRTSTSNFDLAAERLRTATDVPFQKLDKNQLRELEPNLTKAYSGGLFFPGSGSIGSSSGLVEALMVKAIAAGAQLRTARVRTIERGDSGPTLWLDAGAERFDRVVIAAGYESRNLARNLGVSLPIASERGYHVTIPGLSGAIGRPVVDGDLASVATPIDEGLRVVGVAEFAEPDSAVDRRHIDGLLVSLREMIPGISFDDFKEWVGVRPSTPDSLPIIDQHPRDPKILFATGHGHMGISGAPMTAALVSDLLAGREPRIPTAPYRTR
jgi:glycine/D-amino acid oxidase-like deaminating enzyme